MTPLVRYYDDGFRHGYIWKRGRSKLHVLNIEDGSTLTLNREDERQMVPVDSKYVGERHARHVRKRLKQIGRKPTQAQREALRVLSQER